MMREIKSYLNQQYLSSEADLPSKDTEIGKVPIEESFDKDDLIIKFEVNPWIKII